MRRLWLALTLPLVLVSSGAAADDHQMFRLSLPVACDIGEACFIQNHFDHDPGPGFRDYAGGRLGYDGHAGLDIRVVDEPAMVRGIAVVAAAPGKILAVRDGMEDIDVRLTGSAAVVDRKAGNGVVIDHGGGWQTQYNHLRSGSITVKPGDAVNTGQVIGMIGMSGYAAFPHVHFALRHQGVSMDPFGGVDAPVLWDDRALAALPYTASGILAAGFAPRRPSWSEARAGDYDADPLGGGAPALVFWTSLFGGQGGDELHSRLIGPDGTVIAESLQVLEKNEAQYFSFTGRKRPDGGWLEGLYRGEYKLFREIDGATRELLSTMREIRLVSEER